ncbi:Uncharacterised protein [Mycobacteroides abscessus subsp. abscessus]|nr:Uncharacterised protein [Mycobacteroides abscessus subsp. abscessus]
MLCPNATSGRPGFSLRAISASCLISAVMPSQAVVPSCPNLSGPAVCPCPRRSSAYTTHPCAARNRASRS